MSISASTYAGTADYISISERVANPNKKGKSNKSVVSNSIVVEGKLESRPKMSNMLHYFEAVKATSHGLRSETVRELEDKRDALISECDSVDSLDSLSSCIQHCTEFVSFVLGALKLNNQKVHANYFKIMSNACTEMHAYYTERQAIVRKNKQLADGMSLMRDLVDGGSGLLQLVATQEKLQQAEQRVSLLRSSYGKVSQKEFYLHTICSPKTRYTHICVCSIQGMIDVIKDTSKRCLEYSEIESALMIASMGHLADAARLDKKLAAWTVASKLEKVKSAKHRIEKLKK